MNRIESFFVPSPSELPLNIIHDVDLKKALGLSHCRIIQTSDDIAAAFEDIALLDEEAFISCALDHRNRLVRWTLLAIGRETFSKINPIDALIGAIWSSAKSIIVVENVKGIASPRPNSVVPDIEYAGKLLGYPLLDHIIVGEDQNYWSLRLQTASQSKSNNRLSVLASR